MNLKQDHSEDPGRQENTEDFILDHVLLALLDEVPAFFSRKTL